MSSKELEEWKKWAQQPGLLDDDLVDFVGPCAHGQDPYTRCDICGELGGKTAKLMAEATKQLTTERDELREQVKRLSQISALPDLVEALSGYHLWMTADSDEIAKQFYAATGHVAPGKDRPPGFDDGLTAPERNEIWRTWLASRKNELNESACAALARAALPPTVDKLKAVAEAAAEFCFYGSKEKENV